MAKKRVGKFPKAFRQMAVDRLTLCDHIVALANELGISLRLLYTCTKRLSGGSAATAPHRPRGNRPCGTR